MEVIVADLGSLSLSNTFHIAKRTDVSSDSGVVQGMAIFERHKIKLNNLQIFRCAVALLTLGTCVGRLRYLCYVLVCV